MVNSENVAIAVNTFDRRRIVSARIQRHRATGQGNLSELF